MQCKWFIYPTELPMPDNSIYQKNTFQATLPMKSKPRNRKYAHKGLQTLKICVNTLHCTKESLRHLSLFHIKFYVYVSFKKKVVYVSWFKPHNSLKAREDIQQVEKEVTKLQKVDREQTNKNPDKFWGAWCLQHKIIYTQKWRNDTIIQIQDPLLKKTRIRIICCKRLSWKRFFVFFSNSPLEKKSSTLKTIIQNFSS